MTRIKIILNDGDILHCEVQDNPEGGGWDSIRAYKKVMDWGAVGLVEPQTNWFIPMNRVHSITINPK